MTYFQFVWFISAMLLLFGSYLIRCVRLRRLASLRDIHWPGLIVISAVVALLPAYVADQRTARNVDVPKEIAAEPTIVKER